MNKTEYLLICLMEEAAEIQQMASKCLRFGPDNHHPDDPNRKTNVTELQRELKDLRATEFMLSREGYVAFDPHVDGWTLENKIKKVTRYMEVSRECGTLDKEAPHENP
jgi:hypothetical protein